MTRSLAQIQKQIEKLQREADALRQKEVAGVIARIQEAILHYGLTPADLFGQGASRKRAAAADGGTPAASGRRGSGAGDASGAKRAPSQPMYRSEDGRTWTGHGKRPGWFKDALAAGKTPEDLKIKG